MSKMEIKPIIIHDLEKKTDYTLEFNRESVAWAEGRGFSLEDVGRYPMTKLPDLFYYAFRMHHKNVARDQTDKILFEKLGGMTDAMAERLGQLYGVPLSTLTQDGDEEEKNAMMTVEM